MTDKELLEAASRAADLTALFQMYGWNEIGDGAFLDANEPPTVWNPLADDGDALRLAVKLRLDFTQVNDSCCVGQTTDDEPFGIDLAEEVAADHGGDLCAALRRAIVRAAAAMAGDA